MPAPDRRRTPQPPRLRAKPPAPRPPARPTATPSVAVAPVGRWRRLAVNWLTYLLLVVVASLIGLASTDLAVGQWLVAAYAVVAIWRLPSRASFLLALLALVLVPLFSTLRRDLLAENYAVYAYYLLVIGVVQAFVELRRLPPDDADSQES